MNLYKFNKASFEEKLKMAIDRSIKDLKSMKCPDIRINNLCEKYTKWNLFKELTKLEEEYE